MKDKVSIIIPAYNESKNIKRLLLSIKKQSYGNIESIVVDDDSTDNTYEISKKYASKAFKRKHAERSVQRNFGAKNAKGDFLMFLDADMELSRNVVKSCIEAVHNSNAKAIIIPEHTFGDNFLAKVRKFERDMYKGDSSIEVARFFDSQVFNEMNGYDESLIGAEDYDLPHRIEKKYYVGWADEYLIHHEEDLTLWQLLKKKYYYASKSVAYAEKHPELISTQGTILFRRAYFRNWRKFLSNPVLAISFIAVRVLTLIFAVAGYIRSAGLTKFLQTLLKMLLYAKKD